MSTLATMSDRMASLIPKPAAPEEATAEQPEHDEAAFELLHARTSQALWGYLRRLTGDPSVADDVHQESYLRYLARPCPDGNKRRQSAYLFRIATNLVHDRWRRERRERSWLEQLLTPRQAAPETSLSIDFETVFNRLKPRQRALLWLAYVEAYRHHEIAEILGLRQGSIRVLLFRARGQLAEQLRDHGLEPESSQLKEDKP